MWISQKAFQALLQVNQSRMEDLLSQIDFLQSQLERSEARAARYELAFIPQLRPPTPSIPRPVQAPTLTPVESSNWHTYLKNYVEDQDRLAKVEQAKPGLSGA